MKSRIYITLILCELYVALTSCSRERISEIPISPPKGTSDTLILDFPKLAEKVEWDTLSIIKPYTEMTFENRSEAELQHLTKTDIHSLVVYSFSGKIVAYSRLPRNYDFALHWSQKSEPILKFPKSNSRFLFSRNGEIHQPSIQPQIADPGGEILIERVTHGDQPVWMAFAERNMLDDLERVLADKDSLDISRLSYTGISPLELDGPLSEKLDLRLLELDRKTLTTYTISDFKVMFPKSYAVRNYYQDSYLINFAEKQPESYDHLVLEAGRSGKYFHFRFVDRFVVDVTFDGDRGY